jgi:hypothetical protein
MQGRIFYAAYFILNCIVLVLSQCKYNHLFHPKVESEFLSENCKSCHEKIYGQWVLSAHGISGVNIRFREAYLLEPKASCVHCHSPLTMDSAIPYPKAIEEGVGCIHCHKPMLSMFNLVSVYKNNYDCGHCHDFPFPESNDLDMSLNPHPTGVGMQTTKREFEETIWFREKGYLCLSCHFKSGHNLGGPVDRERFASHFQFGFHILEKVPILKVELYIKKIGHHFPTGDLFRSLSIQAIDKKGKLVGSTIIQKKMNMTQRKLISDNRLSPNQKGEVDAEIFLSLAGKPEYCIVRYHLQGGIEKELKQIPEEELIIVLYEGRCNFQEIKR